MYHVSSDEAKILIFFFSFSLRVSHQTTGVINFGSVRLYSDTKVLSGFPFISHGNPDNILESLCILASI
jgi:hypothetical protein